MTAAENDIVSWLWPEKGIKAGTNDSFKVKFRFIERNTSQNEFQGDKLQLKWTFEAQQGEGEVKNNDKKRDYQNDSLFLLKVKYKKKHNFISFCNSLYYNKDIVLDKEQVVR